MISAGPTLPDPGSEDPSLPLLASIAHSQSLASCLIGQLSVAESNFFGKGGEGRGGSFILSFGSGILAVSQSRWLNTCFPHRTLYLVRSPYLFYTEHSRKAVPNSFFCQPFNLLADRAPEVVLGGRIQGQVVWLGDDP